MYFLGLAFTGGDDDIEAVYFVDLQFVLVDLLIEGGFVDDDVVSVNKVLLDFVGEDTFDWVAGEALGNLSGQGSDLPL
jgi:hypothetical protein